MLETMVKDKETNDIPKPAEEFFSREKIIDDIIDSTENAHTDAYKEAANEILLIDVTGKTGTRKRYAFEKLEDKETQKKFIDKMTDAYMKKAREYLGAPEAENDAEKDIILNRYFGITKAQIEQRVKKLKGNYKLKVHEKIRDKHIEKITQELKPIASQNIKEEDIDPILAYTGLSDMLDQDLLKRSPHHLGDVLRLFRRGKGSVSYSDIMEIEQLGPYVKDAYEKREIPAKKKAA